MNIEQAYLCVFKNRRRKKGKIQFFDDKLSLAADFFRRVESSKKEIMSKFDEESPQKMFF